VSGVGFRESARLAEELAVVEGRAGAVRRGFQPAADAFGSFDERAHFRQLAGRDLAQVIARARVLGGAAVAGMAGVAGVRREQRLDLGERQAGALRGLDDRERPEHRARIPPLAANPLGRGDQPDALVVADGRRGPAARLGDSADRQPLAGRIHDTCP